MGIEWDIEILPKAQADTAFTFKPNQNPTWMYPRVPEANMLKVGEEYEDYLFYRGIGNFTLPITFKVDKSETLTLSNKTKETIPFAFAFENIKGKFRYKTIGSIAPLTTATVSESQWHTPKNQQVEVFQEMRQGLIAQGLSKNEANGMIKTWWKSYFDKQGLRVFWIVPQHELAKILPLTLTPKPEKSVRVLVGRADILRPSFEQKMITALGTNAFSTYSQDRFHLSYINRLEQLIKEPVFTKLDESSLSNLLLRGIKDKNSTTENVYFSKGSPIKSKQLPVTGKWQITDNETLTIGKLTFKLDKKKGLLTAKAPADHAWDYYEIQLHRVLN